MMKDRNLIFKFISLWLFFLPICAPIVCAQALLKTIDTPQGGMIVYGAVDGVETQAAAMGEILRAVHNNCGERPQIGQVFKFRGTETVGVFFTVVNHPGGNRNVAGLVVAAQTGPRSVEAALVSDAAERFGTTVNPMLERLFGVWHPGGGEDSGPTSGGGPSASGVTLHTVIASDNSVSVDVPDGWTLDPRSGRGAIIVKGPHGEVVALNMLRHAVDPTSQWQRQFLRNGGRVPPGSIVYPYHGNLAKVFPELFQAWRRANGLAPAKLEIEQIEQMPTSEGQECVQAKGHMDPDGNGMQTMNDMMCAIKPLSWGGYTVTLSHALLPNDIAEQEHDTQQAIIASWRLNQEVIKRQLAQDMQQKAANDQAIMRGTQQAINQIHQIGQQATARYNATQAANDAQHAGYWARQNSNARNSQGFSNYLLDQTVIQDNNMHNNGTVGHGTVWNSTANALVKADPNRFEMVTTPNYWRGVDY